MGETTLAHEGVGRPSSEGVVFLHGFLGDRRDWRPVAEKLDGTSTYALLVDLPGHGQSTGLAAADYTFPGAAAAVYSTVKSAGLARALLVGYSMGGRLALDLVCRRPGLWAGVLVVSGTPGLRTEEERRARRLHDEETAVRLESEPLEAFLSSWYRQPLFGPPDEDPKAYPAWRRRRLASDPVELASALRGMSQGLQVPRWRDLASSHVPVTAVVGGEDRKYVGVAEAMAGLSPYIEAITLPGAWHQLHVTHPEVMARLVEERARSVLKEGTA